MSNTVNRQASIDSRRIALEREIAIRVPRFDSFVTEYSANLSTTGMFIMSEKPQPPGTTFSFEFSVADDWKLIRGKGQVVWTRYRDEGPERPPGMGVKFLELDAQSRRLIRWIVEKHIREGGKPFELDELRSVIDQALEQVLDAEEPDRPGSEPSARPFADTTRAAAPAPRAQTARKTAERKAAERRVLPLVLTAAVVLALVGTLFWLTEWLPDNRGGEAGGGRAASGTGSVAEDSPDEASPENAGEERAVEAAGPPAASGDGAPEAAGGPAASGAEPAAGAAGAATEDSAPPPLGSAYRAVSDVIAGWAGAWSAQDVDRYLSYYSSDYRPRGMSRQQWVASRRERLGAPGFIKVAISNLQIDRIDDRHAQAVFNQSYRSDRFSDIVRKTIRLVWEDGAWKIASEESRGV